MVNICKRVTVSATIAFVGTITAQSADAASLYSLTDLGALTGNSYSFASGINDLGQVILETGFNDSRAFVYSGNQLTKISPLPGDDEIGLSDINNSGQVVGNSVKGGGDNNVFIYSSGITQSIGIAGIPYAINESGQVVGGTSGGGIFPELAFPYGAAFLYSNGTTSILNTDLEASYVAYGINNPGKVVGIFESLSRPSRAFLYDNGLFTDLGTLPGDNYSSAYDINDSDQIVGISAPSDAIDGTAFLYSKSTGMISLGTLNADDTSSAAFDINNKGQIVGSSEKYFSPGIFRNSSFLYSDGVMQDINDLIPENSGFDLIGAQSINEQGQIAGTGLINGELRAVLLTLQLSQAVPEPDSILGMLALGTLGMSLLHKRRLEKQ